MDNDSHWTLGRIVLKKLSSLSYQDSIRKNWQQLYKFWAQMALYWYSKQIQY
jgi:hypothetical protein